jgi:Fe-S cluster assembly ATP-binding protein
MLEINGLKARVAGGDGREILQGVTLTVKPGEVHAIMGVNGSGKSVLSQVLAGRETYEVTGGTVKLDGKDLLAMAPEERARAGLFLAFQHPVEIPGVANSLFLKTALNATRAGRGQPDMDAMDFARYAKSKASVVKLDPVFLKRSVNEGFSGGEKKKNEILQLAALEPKLAILDEIDSGLDVDALRVVADGVNALRSAGRSFILITHHQRLLDYIAADFTHVFLGGRIVKSGGPELAKEVDSRGYDWIATADDLKTAAGSK